MPLSGQYSWKETSDAVHVRLSLMGTSPSSVDVVVSEVYIKISYPPRLVELDLIKKVNVDEKKYRIKDGQLTLSVGKAIKGEKWGRLIFEVGKDMSKSELLARRQAAREWLRDRETNIAERAKVRKEEDARSALKTKMGLEAREESVLEEKKADEKERAESQVYATLRQVEQRENELKETKNEINDPKEIVNEEKEKIEDGILDLDRDAIVEKNEIVDASENNEKQEEKTVFPPPRATAIATISHTPRVFPTPMRASKAEEEHTWIKKNNKYLHKNAMLSIGKTSIQENDPSWLKSKGDEFWKRGDFRSATNAYSAALEIDKEWPACLANRAACELRLGLWDEAARDCDAGLEALNTHLIREPDQERPLRLEAKLIARRAAAFCGKGAYEAAITDFQRASQISEDPLLLEDAKRAQRLAKANTAKLSADSFFLEEKFSEALQAYDQALSHEPAFVSALANRAAARLAVNEFAGAVADCSAALKIFENDTGDDNSSVGPIPPPGSERRQYMVLRTLARRGAALAGLGKLHEAVNDFQAAHVINPNDKKLKADLESLRTRAKAASSSP
mmetsp:Transcript_11117/g.15310  ORF Transcript_11117/g.15310 Transcript_11117/m.15310 type:complete len:566 (+) Transcript_11117:43-1740(+)